MLLRFSVTNFRTFREKATLSLVASNYDKDTRESDNIFVDPGTGIRILKSAVVYGANASGKSKLFEALSFMRHFVINSSKDSQTGELIAVEPFLLSSETEHEPSEFEVVFAYDGVVYRYGFETTKQEICSEWLYYKQKTKEVELFYREGKHYTLHERNFTKGKMLVKQGLVRDNALLVSVAAQFNDKIAIHVIEWFKRFKTLSGLKEYEFQGFTLAKTEERLQKEKILELLKAADLGICDITLQKLDIDHLPEDMPKDLKEKIVKEMSEKKREFVSDIITTHKKYDSNKKALENAYFSMGDHESSGTTKYFSLTGPILDVIENGYTLVVDELDSKLHPNLVCKIVSLFNSSALNPKHAQLIFNTHDTNLLSSGLFRRDQIWFTDKNKYGEASLYSLSDFKSDAVRKTESFEDNYVRGKYGAVPYLNNFDRLNETLARYENEKQKG